MLIGAEDWFPGCFCGSACLRDGDWEWSTGCGPTGRDVSILLSTQRVGVTLRSPELYDLDPDVLGLHAQRPQAPLIKVILRRDSDCVRVLIPDDDVGHRGFHDVVLVDACCGE